MQPSPYTPGALARFLPGRDAQLLDIRASLDQVAVLGEFVGRIRVDIGTRGTGKTSLLRAAKIEAEERGLATVFVTAGNGVLVEEVAAGLRDEVGVDVDLGRLTEATLQLGPPGANVRVTADLEDQAPPPNPPTRALRELVVSAARRVLENERRGLAFFIDEFQACDEESLRTLAYAWQELQIEDAPPPAVLFAAGLAHTETAITRVASFGERIAYRRLENLDEVAVRRALTEPAAELGVAWRTDALAEVVRRSSGYPFFVQVYGEATWKAAGLPDPGAELTLAHLDAAQRDIDADIGGMLRSRWDKTTPKEKELLRAMVELGGGELRRGDIAAHLGVKTTELSMVRESLLAKGILDNPRRGYLSFAAPGFAQVIRDADEG